MLSESLDSIESNLHDVTPTSSLPADEPEIDHRPEMAAVMAELEADDEFVAWMEARDAIELARQQHRDALSIPPIAARPIRLNPSAWPDSVRSIIEAANTESAAA